MTLILRTIMMMRFQHNQWLSSFATQFLATLCCITLTLTSVPARAEVAYVSDVLYVPLHSGPSTKNRIVHRGIKTGSKLEVLDHDKDAKFTKVKTVKGTEGWIQDQFISRDKIARHLLAEAQAIIDRQKNQLEQASKGYAEASGTKKDLQNQIAALSTKNQTISTELAKIRQISSNAIKLDKNNRELLQRNETLKLKIDELESENNRLADKSSQQWFLKGAFAVLLGVVIATLIPLLRPKQKRSDWA